MTIEQSDTIDIASIDKASGELWLTISDHLPWADDEDDHLVLLQDKLNAYLGFIESGQVFEELPNAAGRSVVINIIGKFPLSQTAERFFANAQAAVAGAGFRLQFSMLRPDG
jgi:hypothetical protein